MRSAGQLPSVCGGCASNTSPSKSQSGLALTMLHSTGLIVKKCVSGESAGMLKKRHAGKPSPEPSAKALNSVPVRSHSLPASSAAISSGIEVMK